MVFMGNSFRSDDLSQALLLQTSLRDWLPENHLARFPVDVVETLDLSAIHASYDAGDGRASPQYTKTSLNSTLNNNQLATSVATYDGAGKVTQDSRNAYLYDPEGRLCAVEAKPIGSATCTKYLYDAEGQRVAKDAGASPSCGAPTAANGFSLSSQYLLDQSGNHASEPGPGDRHLGWHCSAVALALPSVIPRWESAFSFAFALNPEPLSPTCYPSSTPGT